MTAARLCVFLDRKQNIPQYPVEDLSLLPLVLNGIILEAYVADQFETPIENLQMPLLMGMLQFCV